MTGPPAFCRRVATIFVLGLLLCKHLAEANISSDFVHEYYQTYQKLRVKAKDALDYTKYDPPIHLEHGVPDEIIEKLQFVGLRFESLPGLLQRALVWDSGYVVGDNGLLTKSYTRCLTNSSGSAMDNIALKAKDIENAGCETQTCSPDEATTISWSYSSDCGPVQLDDIIQCACSAVKTKANEAPVWSIGQIYTDPVNNSNLPEPFIRRHTWSDLTAGRSAILFAIHTNRALQDMSLSNACGSYTPPASLTIPCIEYRDADDRWCRPSSSPLMSKWLREYILTQLNNIESSASGSVDSNISSSTSSPNMNYTVLDNNDNSAMADTNITKLQHDDLTTGRWRQTVPVMIVGGVALVVSALAVFIYLRRRSDQRKQELQTSAANQLSLSSADDGQKTEKTTKMARHNPLIDTEDAFGNQHSMHDILEMLSSSPTAWESSPISLSLALTAESLASGGSKDGKCSDTSIFNAMINDPHMKDTQISFDLLQFHHLIARSSHTEVWLCVLRDRCVAVKRLSKEQRKSLNSVKAFVKTIRLTAPLKHPSIVDFVGIAWNSLQNLCLVTEYLELGDLQEYLRQSNPDRTHNDISDEFMYFSLSWRREKMQLLLDIVRGLDYLHRHHILHGDLRARNILLSAALDAKLIGFGTQNQLGSRALGQSQRNIGVESPFWASPEVLAGGSQTEKADIYSLGVLITELDTHLTPYANTVTARGESMPPLQVLQHIMARQLKPSLLPSCPHEIVDLAEWCMHGDPKCRPTARDVVQAVRSIPGVNLDEFSL
ncbi:unnamed protein product [Phytophthora lilii]|uniref:Unnamed protein product n=1 Tax=Phytophthora lilii TaxID=2077276 RepID=A0A9W6U2C6_9STRA|nr:unnamed protein product [Phytophthora lilii]